MKHVYEQPPGGTSEGARAAWWRQCIMRLEIKELSRLTGYSVAAIRSFEANCNSQGALFGEAAWQRYRMACAGIQNGARAETWNWGLDNERKQR